MLAAMRIGLRRPSVALRHVTAPRAQCYGGRMQRTEVASGIRACGRRTFSGQHEAIRGPYFVRYGPEGRGVSNIEAAQAKITSKVARKHIEGAPVSEMTREDLARMIADINVAVALNAKKLEQIQNFEKKAFGTVSADNFHATLLNIERTLVPVVHFIQTRINKPVFGYHIFNRYTLGVLFAIGLAWFFDNKHEVYQNVGEELAQITSQAIENAQLVRTVENVLLEIAGSPETLRSLVTLLEKAMYEDATRRAVTDVVTKVLENDTVRQSLLALIWKLFQDQRTIELTGKFMLQALQTPATLEGITHESYQLVLRLLRDEYLQRQTGLLLNRSAKFGFLPGFMQPTTMTPAELVKVRAQTDAVAHLTWEAKKNMLEDVRREAERRALAATQTAPAEQSSTQSPPHGEPSTRDDAP